MTTVIARPNQRVGDGSGREQVPAAEEEERAADRERATVSSGDIYEHSRR
jgi:hypothetical protein